MKKYIKSYELGVTNTCAVNCPFITASGEGDQSDFEEVLTFYCEKYKQKLFPSGDRDKLLRTLDCAITKVEWIFYFNKE